MSDGREKLPIEGVADSAAGTRAPGTAEGRERRRAAALRENLRRRKQRQRLRAAAAPARGPEKG